MNLQQINEFRLAHNLKPLQAAPNKHAMKRRQAANQAERAAANREIRAKRNKGGK